MFDGLMSLVTNPWLYVLWGAYGLFMAAVSAMPTPEEVNEYKGKKDIRYLFLYKLCHAFSFNLKSIMGDKLPKLMPTDPEKVEETKADK